jgi:hypothetical protein
MRPHDKNVYREKIDTIGNISIWRVNGNYIRSNIEVEFTNFGQHYRYPFIPKNEFWLDIESHPRESSFYIAHLLKEYELMAQNVPYEKALVAADEVEQRERDKHNLFPAAWRHKDGAPDANLYHEELLDRQTIDGETVYVWKVDSEKVRDNLYIDWYAGGHGYVYPWIPNAEVWIDDDLSQEEIPFVLLHEVHERNLMKNHGYNYNDAHASACKVEIAARLKKNEDLIDHLKSIALKIYEEYTPIKLYHGSPNKIGILTPIQEASIDAITPEIYRHTLKIQRAFKPKLSMLFHRKSLPTYRGRITGDPFKVKVGGLDRGDDGTSWLGYDTRSTSPKRVKSFRGRVGLSMVGMNDENIISHELLHLADKPYRTNSSRKINKGLYKSLAMAGADDDSWHSYLSKPCETHAYAGSTGRLGFRAAKKAGILSSEIRNSLRSGEGLPKKGFMFKMNNPNYWSHHIISSRVSPTYLSFAKGSSSSSDLRRGRKYFKELYKGAERAYGSSLNPGLSSIHAKINARSSNSSIFTGGTHHEELQNIATRLHEESVSNRLYHGNPDKIKKYA